MIHVGLNKQSAPVVQAVLAALDSTPRSASDIAKRCKISLAHTTEALHALVRSFKVVVGNEKTRYRNLRHVYSRREE